ncbi:HpcH/HpaI aldolase/citrate lyase family protein [Curvibacter sp. RS43]|uniref:HpcH/HpaI aldolase family protein n=1 Tax=Curvibacter microcysteis TaxID=3026419 RepID=UPI002360A5E1|nr:HpcH/HpaI aldolase/citrate lyase family protein [Curvibacter sp. RS43]MDD0812574.1 HpcH/HpaI aldolase/citrate lyase family protein [Curvibacter sp. RS43]
MSFASLPSNPLKQALKENRRQVGLWVTFAHQPIAEVLADAGFDWLLFDMEHSPTDLVDVGQQLLAVRGRPVAPIVRVPILDMGWIKRVLDAGAPNIMVPNIRNAAEAREAVSYTRFAPEGLRGVAGSTRAGNYTRYKDYMARANDEIGLVLQIESREALDDLDAICRVPGVDAVFIGPSDLAASLGYRGQAGHPEVQAAIAQAFQTARAAGKAAGVLAADGKAEHYFEGGATMVGVGTDLHLLIAGADAVAARFRQAA